MRRKMCISWIGSMWSRFFQRNEKNNGVVAYHKLYRFATITDKLCIAIGISLTIFVAICQPVYALLYGMACGDFIQYESELIDVQNLTKVELKSLDENLHDSIFSFAIETLGIGILNLGLQYIAGLLLSFSSLRQVSKLRQLFFEKTINQDVSWYDEHQTGQFASTFSENLTKIEDGIGEKVSLCLFYLTVSFSGITMCLYMGWQLTIVCIILLPISSLLAAAISMISSKFCKQEMESYASAGVIAEEVFSAIRTVVAFGGQNRELSRYEKHLKDAKKNNITRNIFCGFSEGLLYFFMYVSCALAVWYSVRLIVQGRELQSNANEYEPGLIVSIIYITWIAYWNIYLALPFLRVFGDACGAATKVFAVIDSKPTILRNEGMVPEFCKGGIIFKNVHFSYPSRPDVKVLNGVSFDIQPGETVAFVGSSGCGKSTCVQLIQRFYDICKGNILIDDNEIKNINLSWWSSQIGSVGQEPCLFATTVAENIRYGKQDASLEDIKSAAKKAQVHDFIESLPKGYNSVIGERGTQLSGGQKQRIAIARALIRKPSVLLLDEATSALDTTSESEVQAAIDSVRGECTTIIIAHRLSTVRNAGRIFVFSNGKIVEQGSYQQLYDQRGDFFKLVQSQNGDSRHDSNETSPTSEENKYRAITEFKESRKSAENIWTQTPSEEEKYPKQGGLRELLKMNRPEWPWIFVGATCSGIIGASFPVLIMLMANIVGEFYIKDSSLLIQITDSQCVVILSIGLIAGICYVVQYYSFGIAGESLTLRIRSNMFSSMMDQEIGWFDRKENAVGAICTKLSRDCAAVQAACGASIGILMNSAATLIVANVLAFCFQWDLAFLMAGFIPVIVFSTYFECSLIKGNSAMKEDMLQKSAAIAVEAIANIRTVKSLGCETIFLDRYKEGLEPYIRKSKKQSHLRAFQLGLARVLMSYGYAAGFSYGAHLMINSNLTYRTVLNVVDLQVQGSYAVGQAFAFLPNFQNGVEAAKRIFAMLRRKPAIENEKYASSNELIPGNIEFSNVHFAYPTRPEQPVLQGLNLEVLAGKTVALVGSSGCGKSTTIQLLERFYEANGGFITIDKESIKRIELQHLRANFAIVSQEPSLFDRSITENIAYGDNSRNVTQEEIIEAARTANIHEFITSLPLGYETRLGTRGTQLSGGQKQRIAIARALVRNPKILLLDEATSALDTESEKVVQEALDKAKENRTCITIAHRLTTIQDADLICVLHNGKIVEMGTHNQLLAIKNHYYKFYQTQSGSKNSIENST